MKSDFGMRTAESTGHEGKRRPYVELAVYWMAGRVSVAVCGNGWMGGGGDVGGERWRRGWVKRDGS